jgi:hypothetical protein
MINTNSKMFLFLRFYIEDKASKSFALSQVPFLPCFSGFFRTSYSLKIIVHHLTGNYIYSHLFVLVFTFLYNKIPNTKFHLNPFRSFRYETGRAERHLFRITDLRSFCTICPKFASHRWMVYNPLSIGLDKVSSAQRKRYTLNVCHALEANEVGAPNRRAWRAGALSMTALITTGT